MPTPIEVLLDPISLVVFAIYAVLRLAESLAPARALPKVPHWQLRGFISFACYFYLSTYLPLLWDGPLAAYQLWDLTGLGVAGGAVVGLLLYELATYAWHRTMHARDGLFRAVHQMHHSAERIDTIGAFWFSPLDMLGWTVLGSLVLTLGVGLDPTAVTIVLIATNFLAIFQHANLRTPRWLGYIVQRPESHAIHHARGIHAHNYSDLPLFDLLFGTFQNPEGYAHEAGFYPGASSRVLDMLLLRDVSAPSVGPTDAVEVGEGALGVRP